MPYQKSNVQRVASTNRSISDDLTTKKGNSLPAVPALQRVEDEEAVQGKFQTAQLVEEEEPVQGKFATAQLESEGEEEESVQGKFKTAQLVEEEEEPVQGKFATAQLESEGEEEESVQGKFKTAQLVEEEEPVQGKFSAQLMGEEEEEPVQGKFQTAQLMAEEEEPVQGKFSAAPVQRQEAAAPANSSGLPGGLKGGIENMSGMDMSDVKVHYNSDKPAQLNALAYAQGSDIHVASGQEKHLPHEAWHVVQQRQGRVQPTRQMKMGVPVNDDKGLENEADVMGAQAASIGAQLISRKAVQRKAIPRNGSTAPMQFATEQQNLAFQAEKAGIIGFATNAAAVLGMSFWETLNPDGSDLDTAMDAGDITSGVTGATGEATNELTGASSKSEDLQKASGDKTKFADKAEGDVFGAIGSSLSALLNVIKAVRAVSDGVGGKTSKMAAGTEAGRKLAEAIKAGFEAAISIQKFSSGSASGALLSALPGLGLAIAAADFVVNMYQANESENAELAMTAISADYGNSLAAILGKNPGKHELLFGTEKRGKMFNRITYIRLKPGLMERLDSVVAERDPTKKTAAETKFKEEFGITSSKPFAEIYAAIRLYEMGSKMAEINQKRKVKGARDMATGLLKIGGEIAAFFPGMGTAVAGGLKGAATGIEVGFSAAKWIQSKARNSGKLGGDINRSEKNKKKEYIAHTKTVYRAVDALLPRPVSADNRAKAETAEKILGSTGVYLPLVYKTNYAEAASVKDQATTIIEAMKAGR